MKKSLSFILALLFLYPAVAQDFCGTIMPASYEQFLLKKDRSHLIQSNSRAVEYVPIQYHIVGDDNGNGYFTLRELVSLHCDLNASFTGADMQFYMYDEVNYINNDEWYVFSGFNAGDNMMNLNNVNNVVNVYITEDPGGVCGYAYFPGSGPSGGGIALNKGCSSYASTTLSHEMGHYMGLPHTFSSFAGIEFVDGSNCNNSGDMFCDTPADFLDFRWSCPYVGSATDPKGDFYSTVIDETLFMSYSMDNCQNRFSLMQEADMHNTLLNQRPYLLNHTPPVFFNLDTVSLKKPSDNLASVAAQQTRLEWDHVAGAEFYHVLVTRFNNPFLFDYDLFVSDNYVDLPELLPGIEYRWKVKPMSSANFCAPYSSESKFTTSPIISDVTLSPPNCNGNSNGEIELLPTGGKAPYFYAWSNGWIANPAFSLSDGTYQVTITDSDGENLILDFELNEPQAMVIDIDVNDGNAIASVLGGTPPYQYNWSDGSTSNTVLDLASGSYVLNVTDGNGCSASKAFVVSGLQDISESNNRISIYPNPVTSGNFLLSFESASSDEYRIDVVNIEGKIVHSQSEYLGKNTHNLEISTGKLPAGMYFVAMTNSKETLIKRFTVIQ